MLPSGSLDVGFLVELELDSALVYVYHIFLDKTRAAQGISVPVSETKS